jgi:hypothetical protein
MRAWSIDIDAADVFHSPPITSVLHDDLGFNAASSNPSIG